MFPKVPIMKNMDVTELSTFHHGIKKSQML